MVGMEEQDAPAVRLCALVTSPRTHIYTITHKRTPSHAGFVVVTPEDSCQFGFSFICREICFLYHRTRVGSQHAVLPEDPAAALGPVRTDLQPVPAPLPQPLRPAVRRAAGGAGLPPRGGLGVPDAVRGVSHLLLLLFILLCRVQPRQEDLESLKLPLHQPDQAPGADAP